MGNTWKKEVAKLLLSYFRTLILYLLLLAVVRMMGKRQIGQMEPSEFVVTMLVANLASIPMQDIGVPLLSGVVPIVTVLGAELLLSGLSMFSIRLRRLLCGKPVILIENGHILRENLRRTRVSLDELTGHLRQQQILDLETVQYAILETNGNLSVFPYPAERPATAREAGIKAEKQALPITIVADGALYRENLRLAEKDEVWLQKTLRKQGAGLKETFLLTVDRRGKVYFLKKEDSA